MVLERRTDYPALKKLFSRMDIMSQMILKQTARKINLSVASNIMKQINSKIADLANLGAPGGGGSITAALFLKRFVPDDVPWLHLDTFAWRPSAKPGRAKGGEALGLRAVFRLLQQRYGRD